MKNYCIFFIKLFEILLSVNYTILIKAITSYGIAIPSFQMFQIDQNSDNFLGLCNKQNVLKQIQEKIQIEPKIQKQLDYSSDDDLLISAEREASAKKQKRVRN